MKRILISAIAILALAACKTTPPPEVAPLCDVLSATIAGTAAGVAKALDCGNVAAIAKDLNTPINKLNICPKGDVVQLGTIGDLVCPKITDFVVTLGVTAIPAAWECKGGASATTLNKIINDNCRKYVTF